MSPKYVKDFFFKNKNEQNHDFSHLAWQNTPEGNRRNSHSLAA